MPSRPSGADKEKERAQNEGCRGAGVSRRPPDRANIPARRHDVLRFLYKASSQANSGETIGQSGEDA